MLRAMESSDLDRVWEINAANVPEVGDVDATRMRHLFDESAIALVSVVEDTSGDPTVAGFCIVLAPGADYDSVNYLWFAEHLPGSMYLDRVAFDERFRGRGLGREMYAEVDRLIRIGHREATSLTLEVNVVPPNEPSLAFHRTLGFGEVGRQMSHGIEVSLMSRPV